MKLRDLQIGWESILILKFINNCNWLLCSCVLCCEQVFNDAIEALRISYKKMNPFCVPFATTNVGSAMLAMDLVNLLFFNFVIHLDGFCKLGLKPFNSSFVYSWVGCFQVSTARTVFWSETHIPHICTYPYPSLCALSSQSYTYTYVLRKGGTGYGMPRYTIFSLETQI